MRSMCQIVNLFVDGEITTRAQLRAMLEAEAEGPLELDALRASIVETVTRLCPPTQAEPIVKLLMEED